MVNIHFFCCVCRRAAPIRALLSFRPNGMGFFPRYGVAMKDAAFVQGDGLRVVSGVKYVSDRHQKNYWLLAVTLVEAHQQVGKERSARVKKLLLFCQKSKKAPRHSIYTCALMLSTTFTTTLLAPPRPVRFFPRRHRISTSRTDKPTHATAASSSSSPSPSLSSKMKILYTTGNSGKFKEASFVFEEFNKRGGTTVEIAQVDADPVEIQGSAEEIGMHKVQEAVRILKAKGAIPEGAGRRRHIFLHHLTRKDKRGHPDI